jgi:hypothetical protein
MRKLILFEGHTQFKEWREDVYDPRSDRPKRKGYIQMWRYKPWSVQNTDYV